MVGAAMIYTYYYLGISFTWSEFATFCLIGSLISYLLTTITFFLVGDVLLFWTLPNDVRFPNEGCEADSGLYCATTAIF